MTEITAVADFAGYTTVHQLDITDGGTTGLNFRRDGIDVLGPFTGAGTWGDGHGYPLEGVTVSGDATFTASVS